MTLQILPRSKTASGTAYVDRGSGAETVVLVHGVGMRAEAWSPQIDRLSRDYRVIAVDLPGHGWSPLLGGEPALPDFVEWLSGVLDELSLGTPVNLVGHSLGALIAAGTVFEKPRHVCRVALLNSVHQRTPEASAAVITRAAEIVSGTFNREAPLSRWFTSQEAGSSPYAFVRSLLETIDQKGYALAYRAFATGDRFYADIWERIHVPALFVTGDGDPNSTPKMSLDMAAAAPRGQAVIIPGHRHMVNLTAPELMNSLLLDWLNVGKCSPERKGSH